MPILAVFANDLPILILIPLSRYFDIGISSLIGAYHEEKIRDNLNVADDISLR